MLYQLQSEIDDEFTDGAPDEDEDWEDDSEGYEAMNTEGDPYDIEYDR